MIEAQLVPQWGLDLVPIGADKHHRYRLGKFQRWLESQGLCWHDLDLAAYRDDLLTSGYNPVTVAAHLSTVRGRYGCIIADNAARDALYYLAREQAADSRPADWKAFVDEAVTRLENATDPKPAPVTVPTSQDRADTALSLSARDMDRRERRRYE